MSTAEVVNNGDHQTVVLPPEIRLRGPQVLVQQDGNTVLLIPKPSDEAWDRMKASLGTMSDDFMRDRERDQGVQPPPVELDD